MQYIERNNDSYFKQKEDGLELFSSSGDISIVLDSFSALVFRLVEKFDTIAEVADYLYNHRKDIECEEMSREDFIPEIDSFIFDLMKQGVFKPMFPVLIQPYIATKNENNYSLYFPFLRVVAVVDSSFYSKVKAVTIRNYSEIESIAVADNDIKEFVEYFNSPIAIDEASDYHHEHSRRLVMLPTTACNLKCQYCYAWRDEKKVIMMKKEIAEAGIEFTVSNALESGVNSVDISFMGGGEPTCNWEVLQHAVEYAHKIANSIGNETACSVTLTTNGVISTDKAKWIGENIDNIKISFDGVREVQEIQRPAKTGSSFEIASRTMRILSDMDAHFLVRITVTNESLDKLEQSVRYLIDNFKPNSIIINPVYVCGSCASHGVGSIKHQTIVDTFAQIQDLGIDKGIDIVIPYDKITYMDVPRLPFCGFQKGNCFLTPEGYISACSEIDASDDERATILFFGAWNCKTNELYVNEEKEAQLHALSISSNPKCDVCNSGLFCPGPCLVRRLNPSTVKKITAMRKNKRPEESFSYEEMELLMSSEHSEGSKIQCAMTKQLTNIQINRIANQPEKLNSLSVHTQSIPCNIPGVQKVITLKC